MNAYHTTTKDKVCIAAIVFILCFAESIANVIAPFPL